MEIYSIGLNGLFNEAKTIHRDLKPDNILLSSRGEAVIADLDGAKLYNSISSAQKLSTISMVVGTPKWMAPEMRMALAEKVNTELPKSDIFSIGLIALYCLDTEMFNKELSPILEKFHTNMSRNDVLDHIKKLETLLLVYLDDFRLRNEENANIIKMFYLLKSMLSFLPCARPSINQLYNDFPLLLCPQSV